MDKYKIIQVKESVFADNDREADRVRQQLKKQGTFLLNLMSSPGSGKTTTLLRTVEGLKDQLRMGVMEADIDSDVDAAAMANAGVRSIQLHTGGMCHLDAGMTQQGLRELGTDDLDLVVLENVGNLVCPAEFDTGAVKKRHDSFRARGPRQAPEIPPDLHSVRRADYQQDRRAAVFRLRYGQGGGVRSPAQPQPEDFPHLRQVRPGRGCLASVAAGGDGGLEKRITS